MVKRQPVVSSVLRSVGYEQATATLEIAFVTGGVYRYFEVPPSVHIGLMAAPSRGAYFQKHVRDAYRCVRLS